MVPPAGAALDSVTMHAVLVFGVSEVALHWSDDTSIWARTEIEAVREEAPLVAVRVTDWSEVTTPVVALNVAVVALAGTVTDGGTVRAARLLEKATIVPPAAAA